ncbi:ATP-binding protein [Phreatobacter sp.]|uniref:ATP-binding protein n=1 Tax=Phreatobacter sp. TaxID=1966341 RepID=UPI0025E6A225|nr:ATP-binding protein [Phreatobacter sp.]
MSPVSEPRPPSRLGRLLARFDSLTARTVLVVLLGIGIVHIVSLWTYQISLDREVALSSDARLADRLLAIKRAVMRVPPEEREAVAHDLSGGTVDAHWSRAEHAVAGGADAARWESLGRRLREVLPELAEEGLVIGANRRGADDPHLALISIRLPDQSWVNIGLVAPPVRSTHAHGALLSTSLMALGALVVSILLVGWLTRPMSVFAEAAKSFYRTKSVIPLPETGPREVRDLAAAFNDMQRRIASLIDDRTQALAAVSHDLKTPITRLRFRVEDVADPGTRTAIAADLDDMERMIDQTLAYLRGDRADEEMRSVDVVAILQTITDEFADRGRAIGLGGLPAAVIAGRHLALKRALGNLVENAVKYAGTVDVAVNRDGDCFVVSILDDGPGIAPGDVDRAMSPFVRLEPSRNQGTGGFGLGLPIAKAIIEGHGGTLSLGPRPEGGLAVTVALPEGGPVS